MYKPVSVNQQHTAGDLKSARQNAKEQGVSLKGMTLTTYKCRTGNISMYEIYLNGTAVDHESAYDANEAKAKWINRYVDRKIKGE